MPLARRWGTEDLERRGRHGPVPPQHREISMAGPLTDEMRSAICKFTPSVTRQVTRRQIRQYAVVTDQRLERYLAGDEAPPMFCARLFDDVVPLERLRPDGLALNPLVPELPLKRIMAGYIAGRVECRTQTGAHLALWRRRRHHSAFLA